MPSLESCELSKLLGSFQVLHGRGIEEMRSNSYINLFDRKILRDTRLLSVSKRDIFKIVDHKVAGFRTINGSRIDRSSIFVV